ncbi:hypothetical protein B0J18DRAFT_446877 [Chaetomium sp. MPI-SDFR-AT-0129]|nr:hypothetical protein B0J18DRAFT_446877 [Chaetomium sp. MPI-SDFR-AT-0129]
MKQTIHSPLAQPGPYGYPMRFGVRHAGIKGFKIYGAHHSQPFRYIEWHTRRLVLHQSAHKRDKSPALSFSPVDDEAATFTIKVHDRKLSTVQEDAEQGQDQAGNGAIEEAPTEETPEAASDTEATTNLEIPMEHTRCRPVTFRFEIPVPTASSTTTTILEAFEWRRAPRHCQETRGIRKKSLPVLETGDERMPDEKFVYAPSGSVLVRLGPVSRTSNTAITATATPVSFTGKNRPLGYTRDGEEIVASYTASRDYRAWWYFQFWGAGASGELGEAFTHVAVMSAMAVFQDEQAEKRANAAVNTLSGEVGNACRYVAWYHWS